MVKKTSCTNDKNGLRKGAWSEDEDNKLRAYIQRYGHWNWSLLPKFAGVSRSGKSCRLRWMNYLRPNMKHGNFTKQEDDLIIILHNQLGNKWSTIAANLPGRSDNEIKNRWNTYLKKQVDQADAQIRSAGEEVEAVESDQQVDAVTETDLEFHQEVDDHILLAGESSSSSSELLPSSSSPYWLSGIDCPVSSEFTSPLSFDEEIVGDFWTQPFLPADSNNDSNIVPWGDSLFSPYNFANDFMSQSFCQDMMITTDEFIWSTLDTYVEDCSIIINGRPIKLINL